MTSNTRKEYESLINRLEKKISDVGSKADLSDKIGVSRSSVSNYLKCHTPMPLDFFIEACFIYEFDTCSFFQVQTGSRQSVVLSGGRVDGGVSIGSSGSHVYKQEVGKSVELDIIASREREIASREREVSALERELATKDREVKLLERMLGFKEDELELWRTGKLKLDE